MFQLRIIQNNYLELSSIPHSAGWTKKETDFHNKSGKGSETAK